MKGGRVRWILEGLRRSIYRMWGDSMSLEDIATAIEEIKINHN